MRGKWCKLTCIKWLLWVTFFFYGAVNAAHAAISISFTQSTYKEVGGAYSQQTTATGGVAPYTYTLASGALPAGTALNSASGLVSGTPTTPGAYSYQIKATDAASATATTTAITGTIIAGPTLVSNPPAVTQTGVAYSQTNTSAGGSGTKTFSLLPGAPTWAVISSSTGTVTGAAASITTPGAFSYTVKVTDASGASATSVVSGTIYQRLAIAPAAATTVSTDLGYGYSQQSTASNGLGPYTYTRFSGPLPAGSTLNSSTGLVSGTTTATGTTSYIIRVTDAQGVTANTGTITGIVNPLPTLSSTPSAVTQTLAGYSQANTVTGGTAPRTFSISAGTLPAWATLNTTTGVVLGTPPSTAAGPFNYTVKVTDALGASATSTVSGTISQRLSIAFTASAIKEVGASYSQQTTASNGVPRTAPLSPYAYSIATGSIPPGTVLNANTGLVSGTPTTAGTYSYTIRATDAQNVTATTTTISTTIAPQLVLTATPSTYRNVGAPYSQTNVATGGTNPYTYTLLPGSTLPPGTSFATGTVSGTPNTVGTYSYTVQVQDAQTVVRTQTTTVNITPELSLLTTNSSVTSVGANYSQTNQGQNGSGGYSYAVIAGALPAGTTLNTATGLVSGALTTAQNFSYQIRVTDSAGQTAIQTVSGAISPELTLTVALSPLTQVGVNYLQTNTGSGGVGPYQYSVTAGALPAGTSLNTSTGNVTGTPTTAGSFSYAITVTDSQNTTKVMSIGVGNMVQALLLNSQFSAVNQVGQPYSQTNIATGGTTPYTYAISAGALPPGTGLNASGTVTGTPTTEGAYNYTVTVTDANGTKSSQTLSVQLASELTLNAISSNYLQVDALYSQSNIAEGGTQPYTYTVTAGALPANTTLNSSTGMVSGTPGTAGYFEYIVTVTDSDNATAAQMVSGEIGSFLQLTSILSPVSTIGEAYSQSNQASGGAVPYSYSVSGTLPTGLTLNTSTGLVSGTPSQAGAFEYTITAKDSQGFVTRQTITVNIDSKLELNASASAISQVGLLYSQTNTATGGDGLYLYQIIAGSVPPGTQLDSASGLVYGIPKIADSYQYTIQVTDSQGLSVNKVIDVTIADALILTAVPSPTTEVGVAYNQVNTASGGTPAYAYTLLSGTLPPGTVLNPDGSVTGIPTSAGTFIYSIQVEDQNAATAEQQMVANIQSILQLVSDPSSVLQVGGLYRQTNTATGGIPPYQYTLTSGTLPDGTTLDANSGEVSGVLTTAGTFNYEITVTDSNGITAAQNITAQITAIPAIIYPDPTEDLTVKGLISAQTFSAVELSQLQIDQTHGHLINLHNGTEAEEAPISSTQWMQNLQTLLPQMAQGTLSFNQNLFQTGLWTFWASGVLDYASLLPESAAAKQNLHTSSVTLGWDALVHPQFIVGMAAGYGIQDNEADNLGATNHASNTNISAYLSYEPQENWFIDFLVGYGQFDNESERWSSDDAALLSSDRDGTSIYTSLSFSHSIKQLWLTLEPYFRGDAIFTHFDDSQESSPGYFALNYNAMDLNTEALSLGLSGYRDIRLSAGVLRPLGSVEYARVFGGEVSQDIYYADLGANSLIYNLGIAPIPENSGSLEFGLSYIRDSGAQISGQWRGTLGDQSYRSNQIGLNFIVPF